MSNMKKNYLFAFFAIFFWSTTSTVSKFLLGSMTSFQTLCLGSFFAMTFFLLFNVSSKKQRMQLKAYKALDYAKMALIGAPGTFLYYVFFYTGTDLMPASQALIVNYLWPICSVAFACVLLNERVTLRKIFAFLLSFFGIIVVVGKDLVQFDLRILLGALSCVGAAFSYGLFTALNKKFRYDKNIFLMVSYTTSFLLTGLIAFFSSQLLEIGVIHVLGLVWNGVFAIAIANLCWLQALEGASTAKISNLAYMTPFISLIWTSIFLHEAISASAVIGLVIIIGGILIQLKEK